ncbi:MAG: hypothetical protein UHN02_06080 [Acutalibacteraceae bacterium]|nr:hypothetical protein [Acutalibacteraceae bacterium]
MKFCDKCGKEVMDETVVCPECGATIGKKLGKTKETKCMPAFILGLIGAIFGLFGGICVTACYSFGGNDGAPMFFMIGGSLIGLIGSCLCFKKAKFGSILEIVAAVMIAYCAFTVTGADITSLVGMLLLGVGGAIGLVMSLSSK